MALPTSGSLSIKATAGSTRSIECAVTGSVGAGACGLLTLGDTAFTSAARPHCSREFYGYS